MNRTIYCVIFSLLLVSCSTLEENDLEGEWLVEELIYNGEVIQPYSLSQKVAVIPVGYEGMEVLTFNTKSKCRFPGINSFDLNLRWQIISNSLVISYDSNAFYSELSNVLGDPPIRPFYTVSDSEMHSFLIDSTTYSQNVDSVMSSNIVERMRTVAEVYIDTYIVKRPTHKTFILEGKSTNLRMISSSYIQRERIDGLLAPIRK